MLFKELLLCFKTFKNRENTRKLMKISPVLSRFKIVLIWNLKKSESSFYFKNVLLQILPQKLNMNINKKISKRPMVQTHLLKWEFSFLQFVLCIVNLLFYCSITFEVVLNFYLEKCIARWIFNFQSIQSARSF